MGRIDTRIGFLTRLARDVRGNTLAIMAAAMLPLAGLIGGGVDMSRLYLVKTRLQQACDAGALAGRKAQAGDGWTTGVNNGSTNDRAEKMFEANFVQGQYGTGTVTKSFSESSGVVSGTSTAIVPMTIMKVFGMQRRSITVNCTAKMELPNTDVMFVLDVTKSMDTNDKIGGLRSAVKCFYEALLRANTTEVCGNDPTATTTSSTAQIRIGFVPYGVNVNVGKLLTSAHLASSWTYQSRVPVITPTVYAWALGSLQNLSWFAWTTPASVYNTGNFGSFSTYASNATMNDNTVLQATISGATNGNCGNNNTKGSGSTKMAGIQDASNGSAGSTSSSPSDQNPPVYVSSGNPSVQNQTISHSRTNTISYGYKYTWSSNACRLQRASPSNGKTTYTQTQSGTAEKPITWTPYYNVVTGWSYQPVTFDVSSLKAGGSTVSIPDIATTNGPSVTLSGSATSTTLLNKAPLTITWDGCIEERHTWQTTATDPSSDWPLPTSHSAEALDMNIDLVPSGSTAHNSYWGPMLRNATFPRSSFAFPQVTNTSTTFSFGSTNYNCPLAARKLQPYPSPSGANGFEAYVNQLTASQYGTYHDIGMLWGARLLSPTGIFGSENAATPSGRPIKRHLIFMTDGNAQTVHDNLYSYGVPFLDRRQTSYDPSTDQLDKIVNARMAALCEAVKNMNIELWVVSYGGGLDEDNENRLTACSSSPHTGTKAHYFTAANRDELIDKFRTIANEISELRLTQ